MIEIRSAANPRIRELKKMSRPGKRSRFDAFVVEGYRELVFCAQSNFEIIEWYLCEGHETDLGKYIPHKEPVIISKAVFETLVYRETSGGVLALVKKPDLKIDSVLMQTKKFVLVVEGVEKPGNLGAIMRTAEAAGVDYLILVDSSLDPFNANVVRNSLGAFFTLPWCRASSREVIEELKKNGIECYTATPEAKTAYFDVRYGDKIALILGAEHDGLSEDFRKSEVVVPLKIPMQGKMDSLNLSVSTAVILFEMLRQKASG